MQKLKKHIARNVSIQFSFKFISAAWTSKSYERTIATLL